MKNKKIIGLIVSLALVITVGGVYAVDMTVGELLQLVNGNEQSFGGSTQSDWNVGGALNVTGATTLTGTLTSSGALVASGALTVSGATDVSTFTQGGGITASSTTNATETLLATDFDVENFIDYTANIDTTLTLPATSTLSAMIPNAGDTRDVILRSATTTAATTITLAAGTGIDLQFVEATGGDLVLNGLDVGILKFIRQANTDILVLWNEYTEGD